MMQGHNSHKGELLLQERRNTPREVIDGVPHYIQSDMPQQHAEFFASLPYWPLATLDQQGRPWVSLLVTQSESDPTVGIKVSGHNKTDVVAQTNPHDPFVRSLNHDPKHGFKERLFAGVGIDFSNRRRNKIAGSICAASVDDQGKIALQLTSDQHLGNCPKYITVRGLAHQKRIAILAHDRFETNSSALPDDAKAVVERASTAFLATKHTTDASCLGTQADMGVNHRGGAPGFTRIYEEKDGAHVTTYLVIPDHSGNRFYQSLGNIETDPQVGVVFPDFTSGHVLYITGDAENLLDDEAEALMPRVRLLTRIKVTGVVFVKNGLNLKLTSKEQLSPYNPPVRHLSLELQKMGHATTAHGNAATITATLVSTNTKSDNIKTFNFELSEPVHSPLPGGFGVFDFSGLLDAGYSHMNEANPQLVNEDFVRTWTLSGTPSFDKVTNAFRSTNEVSITVKKKPGGLMSNVLHNNADKLITHKLPVGFKGTGGGFTCFSQTSEKALPTIPPKMLWIAGGVGITPFLAMWDGIVKVASVHPDQISSDIVLLFSGRGDDINVLNHFAEKEGSHPAQVNLTIVGFQSPAGRPLAETSAQDELRQAIRGDVLQLERRRMQIEDIQSIPDLDVREVFMCGPDGLMAWSDAVLADLGVEETRRHRESFVF